MQQEPLLCSAEVCLAGLVLPRTDFPRGERQTEEAKGFWGMVGPGLWPRATHTGL